jgi:hypothetical protein
MIATMGDREDYDPTSTCRLTIDNQVTRERRNIFVMKPRSTLAGEIMAQFTEIDPVTDQLVWSDDDPLRCRPFDTCAVFPGSRFEPIVIRIYANKGRKAALRALKQITWELLK